MDDDNPGHSGRDGSQPGSQAAGNKEWAIFPPGPIHKSKRIMLARFLQVWALQADSRSGEGGVLETTATLLCCSPLPGSSKSQVLSGGCILTKR